MSPSAVDDSSEKRRDLGVVPTPKIEGEWTIDKVAATIPGGQPVENSSSPLPYFHLLERLKTTKREGWRRFGVDRGESIADHMYRMSLMAMLAPPSIASRVDIAKCMKMCLIHDMAESLVGDITPVDNVPRDEKHKREKLTMDYITTRLLGNVYGGSSGAGKDISEIWEEYEKSQSLESKFVHDIDKMELLLQMVEYEKRGEGRVDLGEFAYVATNVNLPETKEWAVEVLKERDSFWQDRKHVRGEDGVEGGLSAELVGQQSDYYSFEQKD